jgi:phosphatidylglycerophosphate synthase
LSRQGTHVIDCASQPDHGWYIVLPRPLLIDAGWRIALLGGILAALALALVLAAGLDWRVVAGALVAYTAIAALIVTGIDHHLPHRRFGLANTLTLSRAAYVALLVGIIADGSSLSQTGRWLLVGTGFAALLLDGADGWAARRAGLVSRFGARFDMEVDAFFVLVLAALVWRAGQAGGWVLTCGLMRYIFVVSGQMWPVLAGPLAPCFRRKAICGVEIAVLVAALAPPIGPGIGGLLCLGGLMMLAYSFAADAVQLLAAPRQQRRAQGMTT